MSPMVPDHTVNRPVIRDGSKLNAAIKLFEKNSPVYIRTIAFKTNASEISPGAVAYSETDSDVPLYIESNDNGDVLIKTVSDSIMFYNADMVFWHLDYLEAVDLTGVNTSECKSMRHMFGECSSLKNVDFNSLDLSSVKSLTYVFSGCTSLVEMRLCNQDLSNVLSFEGFLEGCKSLEEACFINLGTSNLYRTESMFEGCESLKKLDLSGITTSKVIYMNFMFEKCRSLVSLDIHHFETPNVRWMGYMFSECESLQMLDISGLDVSGTENASRMFYGCMKGGGTIIVGKSFTVSNIPKTEYMFSEAGNIVLSGKIRKKEKAYLLSKIEHDRQSVPKKHQESSCCYDSEEGLNYGSCL